MFPKPEVFLESSKLDGICQKIQFDIVVVTSLGRWVDFKTQEMWLENPNAQNAEQNLFEELNAGLLKKELPNSVMPFANIAGKNPSKLVPYLQEQRKHFKGMKVLASSVVPVNAPEFQPLLRFCEKENWSVLVHCAAKDNSPLNFQSVLEAATAFPSVNFTASHCGGDKPQIMSEIVAPAMQSKNTPKNLFLNTAIKHYNAFAKLIKKIGLERVVFGSDMPLLNQNHQSRIEGIIGKENIAQVFNENARLALNLKEFI